MKIDSKLKKTVIRGHVSHSLWLAVFGSGVS